MFIYAVHYKKNDNECYVIDKVKYSYLLENESGYEATKASIIDTINDGLDVYTKYKEDGQYVIGDKVIVVKGSYIRTDGSNIEEDNLGNLPRY